MKQNFHALAGANSSSDDDLIAIAHRFETGLREWFDFVRQAGLSGYDEQVAGARAEKLRETWGNDLAILKSIVPQTVRVQPRKSPRHRRTSSLQAKWTLMHRLF